MSEAYMQAHGHDESPPTAEHLTVRAYFEAHEHDTGWRESVALGILEALRKHRLCLLPSQQDPYRRTPDPPDTGLVLRWMRAYSEGDSTDAEALAVMHVVTGAGMAKSGSWDFCEWAASEAWGEVKKWWEDYGERTDYDCWVAGGGE